MNRAIVQGIVGDLVALEIYAGDGETKFPEYLKKLIIHDQMVIAQDNYEPPVKKSKKDQSGCIN